MNKKLISVLTTIVLLGTLTGVSEAKSSTPFGYTSTGVDIVDFELDFKDIEVMLDVQVTEEIPTTQVEQTGKINELTEENQVLREENNILKEENEELDGRIFELENLVSALEVQVTNLNTIVTEQIKVICNWVLGYSIN